jgi:hypothetical protein
MALTKPGKSRWRVDYFLWQARIRGELPIQTTASTNIRNDEGKTKPSFSPNRLRVEVLFM